jgi:hopanoid biosynthesis associated protein HpnK
MVNGEAFAEAIELAKANPTLGVGLHLSLCCGTPTLPAKKIPSLINSRGEFSESPVAAGIKYFFSPSAHQELAREIDAQVQKFAATGLRIDHLNGHLHLHLHPTVFSIVQRQWQNWNVPAMRCTYDPATIDLPLGHGRWFYRLTHAVIFRLLSAQARRFLVDQNIKHTNFVFGLLENGLVTESYILRLLKVLPGGDSELYSHPSLHEFRHEYDALVSPRVMAAIAEENIKLIRYQDL